jgi:hypothetical protein
MSAPLSAEAQREALLAIWLETNTPHRSPYARHKFPPMWLTLTLSDGRQLLTRPCSTQSRPSPHSPYKKVDGVGYQFARNGQWQGQGITTTFSDFALTVQELVDCGAIWSTPVVNDYPKQPWPMSESSAELAQAIV